MQLLNTWEINNQGVKPRYPSPYLSRGYINDYLISRSALIQAVFDCFLGLLLLFFLHRFASDTLLIFHTLGSTVHIEVLKSEIN